MYITKKELLEQTGVSNGQLYRWKREGLIPEEWFIKRASRTGQETLLPRELILERLSFIREHKGSCSLEEMAAMFSIHKEEKEFNKDLLKKMEEIHPDIVKTLKDGEYSRAEVAFLAVVSALYQNHKVNKSDVNELLAGCADYFAALENGRHLFRVFRGSGRVYGLVTGESDMPLLDKRLSVIAECQIEEMASGLAMKYLDITI